MGITNIVENIYKRGLKDVLDKDVRKSYSEFGEIEENGLYLEVEDIVPYAEQLVYRMYRCSRCTEKGKCIGYDTAGCSCECPQKMLPPSSKCAEDRWPKMMEAEEWAAYKKENQISFLITQI